MSRFRSLVRVQPEGNCSYACVVDTTTGETLVRYTLDIAGLALADQAVSVLNQAMDIHLVNASGASPSTTGAGLVGTMEKTG